MIIGTVRIEEARGYNSHEGFHSFHAPETQEEYGSFEVYWQDSHICATDEDTCELGQAGWYWAAGFPGCLPDGEPTGPFAYSQQAHEDADEWHPDYDES